MIARHYKDLLNFCLRRVRDRDKAADLAQESYARVLAMQESGQVILEPAALLKTVAVRAEIDMHRRAVLRQHEDIDALNESQHLAGPRHLQPEEACATAQVMHAYLETIESLPPRCREAFSMYLFDDLPNKEIAARLGVTVGMVDQYIRRGKLACLARRKALGDEG